MCSCASNEEEEKEENCTKRANERPDERMGEFHSNKYLRRLLHRRSVHLNLEPPSTVQFNALYTHVLFVSHSNRVRFSLDR